MGKQTFYLNGEDIFAKIEKLEQENKELKEERNRAVNEFNALMTDIIIDIPFTGIKNTNISIKSHLHKMQKALKALEEIREICKMDCGNCQYNQDCDCNFQECEEAKIDDILNKINEVLNDRD